MKKGVERMEEPTKQKAAKGNEVPRLYPLNGAQALQVLSILAEKDAEIAKEIERLSAMVFCDVSVEDVAFLVFNALDGIDVEDCWNASGRQREGGYRDEYDVADEMVSEAFYPFTNQIDMFYQTGEYAAEQTYMHGVLLGLYQCLNESTSDFFEQYMEDYPEMLKQELIDGWKKRHPDDASALQMLNTFIEEYCPDWGTEETELGE